MQKLDVTKRSITLAVLNGEKTKSCTFNGVNPDLTAEQLQQGVDELATLYENGYNEFTVSDKAHIVDED